MKIPIKVSTALLLLMVLLCAGCGGITATKSISPLDFFLPGLLQNETPSSTNSISALAAAQISAEERQ